MKKILFILIISLFASKSFGAGVIVTQPKIIEIEKTTIEPKNADDKTGVSTHFKLISACQTDATGGDGVRHSCEGDRAFAIAEDGYVIAEKGVSWAEMSGRGSDHQCHIVFSDYVEVIPGTGITQPRKVELWATATGPSGYFKGRGWQNCHLVGYSSKYK